MRYDKTAGYICDHILSVINSLCRFCEKDDKGFLYRDLQSLSDLIHNLA